MAYIGKSPSVGIRNRFLFTATSGQTTFSGADDDSRTLSYTDAKFLDIYLNGVLLDPNTDYTATTGTSVVLAEGAATDDLVEIIAFDTFSLFDGTFEDDVTVGRDLSVTRNVSVTGSLGVGVANPSTSLDVVRAGVQPLRIESTSGTEVQINMVNTGGNVQLEAHSGNFNIDADAVGIGTTNPSGLMSFAKGSRTLDLKLEDSPATGDSGVQFRAGSGDFLGLAAGGGTGVGIVINDSNNVGIGTSPSYKLDTLGSSAVVAQFKRDASGGASGGIRVGNNDKQFTFYADNSNGLTIYDGSTERLRIDSSGRVGIGANISSYPASGYDSRSNDFVLSGAGDTGLTIAGGSSEDIRLVFTANGTSGLSKGSLTYDNANDSLAIETSGTGRMTVDGNGLVLIGTTDTSPYNNSAGSSADNGVVFSAGRIWAARYSGTPMDLNRTSDDGTLIDFRKNGSVVGQIGVSGNGFYFGDEGDTGFVIDSNTDAIIPFNPSTRAIRNNAIDLGSSSGRFGNLYLGNSVNLAPTVQNSLTEIEFGVLNAGTTAYAKIDAANFVNYDTNLRFFTNAVSSTTQVERMRISSTGQLFLFTQTSGAGNATLKYTTGTGAVTYDTSSRLVKENIVDCPYGLTEIVQLQPRKYFRTDDQANEVGLIADEVQSIMPEFVPTGKKSLITGIEEDTEIIPLGVNYDKMVAPLVQAIKDLNAKIETLEAKVTALENS